jgi:endonuclease/exonuclease/phosphatase family metal-dependent hydrolase
VLGLSPPPKGASAERPGPGQWFAARAGGALLINSAWYRWDDTALAKGTAADAVTSADLAGVPAPVAVVGVPDRKLRFAAYNIYHDYRGIERTTGQVRKLDPPPDFVFLAEIEPQNVRPWAEALKARGTCYPPLGRGLDGSTLWPDTAILSRHHLFDGRPLQMPDGQTFGLWSIALVDNKKFAVAAVHLWPTFGIDPRHVAFTGRMRNQQLKILAQTWQDAGSPPLIVGGDFNQPPVGDNYALMTEHFSDTLKALGRDGGTFPFKFLEVRIDYLLATPEWAPAAGGVMKGDASDHRLIWLDVGAGTSSGAEPRPTSRRATRQSRLQ